MPETNAFIYEGETVCLDAIESVGRITQMEATVVNSALDTIFKRSINQFLIRLRSGRELLISPKLSLNGKGDRTRIYDNELDKTMSYSEQIKYVRKHVLRHIKTTIDLDAIIRD